MFPVRYGRRNSCNQLFTCLPVGGGLVGNWLVDANTLWLATVTRVGGVVLVCVGQALGLLVPVGWALLLYTSGLSTQ